MVPSNLDLCALLEASVLLFQVAGVCALCVYRFFPGSRWSQRSLAAFMLAIVGLGVSGALCGRFDSEFALFAGGTMTVLLIGMTMGTARPVATAAA